MNVSHSSAVVAVLWCLTGCCSSSLGLSPKVAPAVKAAAPDLPIRLFNCRTNKGSLEVEATLARNAGDYRDNLDLEVISAATLCRALATSPAAFACPWEDLELRLVTQYGPFGWRTTTSFITIHLSRENLQRLHTHSVPPASVPHYWRFIRATKMAPPHSTSWREWEPAVGAPTGQLVDPTRARLAR